MSKQHPIQRIVIIAAALAPAIVLVFFEGMLHQYFAFANIPADQKLIALISYLAAAVVIWYTWETRTLRKLEERTLLSMSQQTDAIQKQARAADQQSKLLQQQMAAQIQPYIMMRKENPADDNGHRIFTLENIGPGIGLNLTISELKLTALTTLVFPVIPAVSPVKSVSGFAEITIYDLWPLLPNNIEATAKGGVKGIADLFTSEMKPGDRITVTYEDLKHNTFKAVFQYDPATSGQMKILAQDSVRKVDASIHTLGSPLPSK